MCNSYNNYCGNKLQNNQIQRLLFKSLWLLIKDGMFCILTVGSRG